MNNLLYTFLMILCSFISCKKSDFLEAKPDQSLIIPQKLSDFQALIDYDVLMNGSSNGFYGVNPAFGLAASDDYYIYSDARYTAASAGFQNLYIWQDDIYSTSFYEWNYPYRAILYANTVLDGISSIPISEGEIDTYNNIVGSALFFRSQFFYQLSQVFSPPYDINTSKGELGIVLRLRSDINEPIKRATVSETYDRVISDLKMAIDMLPLTQTVKTRPSKKATLGLLARIYLSMRNYDSAFLYADKYLSIGNSLMDFNQLNLTGSFPVPRFNEEVSFHSLLINNNIGTYFGRGFARVDSNLVETYDSNDLRSAAYLRNETIGKSFKGSYDGSQYMWGGVATDELYLIRAECYARKGDVPNAMKDLNDLLVTRWKTNTYQPYSSSDAREALQIILLERRKELLFRGLRWTDLRRLNKESANIMLTRKVFGQLYSLSSNSLHYTFLIPPDVISINPNMSQNPR